MSENYYQILGIQKSASQDEIKKAYKKLAVKEHPDKGGDAKKFQSISNAYNVLSDPKKRENYDRFGNENANRPQNPHDIFAHFFGKTQNNPFGRPHHQQPVNVKCNDILHNYNISLRECYTGVKKQIKIKTKAYKFDKLKQCETCQGVGSIKNVKNMGVFTQIFESQCNDCKGTGVIDKNNNASYEIEKIVDLEIPCGVQNNHHIVLEGLGEQPKTKNYKAGNLIFKINIQPNDVFERIGNDLYSSINIDFISSITGANIRYNIMDEDIFEFNTKQFNIVYPEKKYKFENKGMKYDKGNKRGDLYLSFNINYPTLSDSQRNNIHQSLTSIVNNEN